LRNVRSRAGAHTRRRMSMDHFDILPVADGADG
jgi:hypothetical protein